MHLEVYEVLVGITSPAVSESVTHFKAMQSSSSLHGDGGKASIRSGTSPET